MNNVVTRESSILATLYDPKTIRQRAHLLLDLAKKNKLKYFAVHPEQMHTVAEFVINIIHKNYPTLDIPYHSRWRHFEIGQIDRIQNLLKPLGNNYIEEQGRILYELVIISVLLDAGAGPLWHYHDALTNQEYSRSEGLALASLSLYQSGILSNDSQNPYRVDAQKLIEFSAAHLIEGFQVDTQNPLEGINGRVALLNQLGTTIQEKQQYFGKHGRLGDFYSYVSAQAHNHHLSATVLFQCVLQGFNNIWPTRLNYHGISLGDVWKHPHLNTGVEGSDFMPFHKLSQWLCYSLIEPLEYAGIKVDDLDALTGLPEYRNGGLLIDMGLLSLKDEALAEQAHEAGSELIVEWRALTVALLDELAQLIRQKLNQSPQNLPLAKILQGGTWEAGRQIAREKRVTGTPPLQIISDGTVF